MLHVPTTHWLLMQRGIAFGTLQGEQVVGPQPYIGSSTPTQLVPHIFMPVPQPVVPPPCPPVPPSTPPSGSPEPPCPPDPPMPELVVVVLPLLVPVLVTVPDAVEVLGVALQPNHPA